MKVEKCGSTAWTDVFELSQKLKEGSASWEELNLDDVDIRLKWAGLFHRGKRTPGKFMMRLKVRNMQKMLEQMVMARVHLTHVHALRLVLDTAGRLHVVADCSVWLLAHACT